MLIPIDQTCRAGAGYNDAEEAKTGITTSVVLFPAGTWRRAVGLMLISLVSQSKISAVEKHRTWIVCELSCVEQFRFMN
jgi:hypothetical protein